jgi:hypothetical protein
MGVGGIAGYAAANNTKISSALKTKYLACAAVTSAFGLIVAGGAVMTSSAAVGATVMGAGVILAAPITLLAYTTGYQVGKIVHIVKPDMLPAPAPKLGEAEKAMLARCDPSAQPAAIASGGPTSPAPLA